MSSTLMQQPRLIPVQSIQAKPRWQLDPSCVLYLPLWNISGDQFLSQDAYGHTVTRYGATATGQGGMSFDGVDDYLEVPNHSSLNVDYITISAWVNFRAFTSAYMSLVSKEAAGKGYTVLAKSNGTLALYFQSLLGSTNYDGTGLHTLTTNRWYHLVASYNGRSLVGYVDTKQDKVVTSTPSSLDNSTGALRASSWFSGGRIVDGRIGEVAIFNRVLSALEIQNLYDSTRGRYGG